MAESANADQAFSFVVGIIMSVKLYNFNSAGVISKTVKNEQVLDRLQVERERGITVKAQSASLIYKHKGTDYLLNLIDTPVSICQTI